MSGGSFDYLYRKTMEEAIGEGWALKEMAEFLRANGGTDAAAEVEAILAAVEALQPRWDALAKPLGVFHAAEWYRSCDWGPEDLEKSLGEWRRVSSLPADSGVESK